MEKNADNKVNCQSQELASYNITFERISGTCNKAVDSLSRLVEVPQNHAVAASIFINAVTASPAGRPATHTQSKTKVSVEAPLSDTTKVNAPPPLLGDHKDTLLQMQWTDPFCKHISRQLINGRHQNMNQTPKSWHFTILFEAYDKLG